MAMPPGRPEAEPVSGEGGPSGFGPHQKLDLGGGRVPAVPGRFRQEGEQAIQVGHGISHRLFQTILGFRGFALTRCPWLEAELLHADFTRCAAIFIRLLAVQ
jgi:hypothetical protein